MESRQLPCGGMAIPEGCGARCSACDCVIGSVGMPEDCRELMDAEKRKDEA